MKVTAERLNQLAHIAVNMVGHAVGEGVKFEEAKPLFSTVIVVLDQVEKTPDASEDALAALAFQHLVSEFEQMAAAADLGLGGA